MDRVWPWALAAGGMLAAGLCAAHSSGSAVVALGGGFVATQLVAPVFQDGRRGRPGLPSARPLPDATTIGRPARATVAWVRLDVKPGQYWSGSRPTGPAVVRMAAGEPARHTS